MSRKDDNKGWDAMLGAADGSPAGCASPEQLHRLVVGDMQPAERARIEEHLSSCPACAAEMELAAQFELPAATGVEPRDLHYVVSRLEVAATGDTANVSQVSQVRVLPKPAAYRQFRAPLFALAAAAMLLLVVGVSTRSMTSQPPALVEPAAADTSRGVALEPLYPLGALETMPDRLIWRAVDGAAGYRVSIHGVDDEVLWAGQATATSRSLPDEVVRGMHVGVTYYWTADARDTAGRRLAWSQPTAWHVELPSR